jgi:hypothetical protein
MTSNPLINDEEQNVRVQVSNCNTLLEPVATVGDENRTFPYTGKSYGPNPDRDRAWDDAWAWIKEKVGWDQDA